MTDHPAYLDARERFATYRALVQQSSWEADPHLQALVAHYDREGLAEALTAFGAESAGALDALVRHNNRDEHLPKLQRYDDIGRRIEAVDFHPSYHAIGRKVYGTGAMSRYAEPGHELESLAFVYLFAQNGEGGHACPMACTAGMIKILQADERDHSAWLEKLTLADYDRHYHGSQFLTEVQGGSDVGANAMIARPADDGSWRVFGEKWFCSVIDAHLFLVTARPEGAPPGTRGLKAFVVPRHHADGTANGFAIRRLKYKLGTRTMASAEVDFTGATAFEVGDFRRVVEIVLNTSRLYNAICSSGILQRAWREADSFARTRGAFGQRILDFPAVARTVAGLRVEAYAARSLTFFLADLGDRLATGEAAAFERRGWRMLVNLNKYWTACQGTLGARDAIEVLGGNGTIEEFTVLPRLLRDSIVCEAWEGAHNVLCAQVLRDSRQRAMHRDLFALLEDLCGPHPRLTEIRELWDRLVEVPEAVAATHIRDVVDRLRPVAQALSLRRESKRQGADPLLPTVIDHLLETTRRGYDPLTDETLMDRVRTLTA